jgi:hypothetical protein
VTNPKPVRQSTVATCDRTALGLSNACVMSFGKVATGRLLQIDVVSCVGVNFELSGGAVLFNTNVQLDAAHIAASLPLINLGTILSSGPFYFKQEEVPKVVVAGGQPTFQAFCSINGTLWQTN